MITYLEALDLKTINSEVISSLIVPFSGKSNDQAYSIRTCSIQREPIHLHAHFEFVFVLRGSVSIEYGFFKEHLFEENHFVILNPMVTHRIWSKDSDNLLFVMEVSPSLCPWLLPAIVTPNYYLESSFSFLEKLNRAVFDLAADYEQGNPPGSVAIYNHVVHILSMAGLHFQSYLYHPSDEQLVEIDDFRPETDRMRTIWQLIAEGVFKENPFSLEQLSYTLHLNKEYLSRFIKKQSGYTFVEISNIIKCYYSSLMLLATDFSIEEIISRAHFSSHAYFLKQFKQVFNMTAAEYKKDFGEESFFRKPSFISEEKDILQSFRSIKPAAAGSFKNARTRRRFYCWKSITHYHGKSVLLFVNHDETERAFCFALADRKKNSAKTEEFEIEEYHFDLFSGGATVLPSNRAAFEKQISRLLEQCEQSTRVLTISGGNVSTRIKGSLASGDIAIFTFSPDLFLNFAEEII